MLVIQYTYEGRGSWAGEELCLRKDPLGKDSEVPCRS